MNKIIPATQARQKFFELIDDTDHPGKSVVITIDGHPKVVMMSFEEFESWQETLEVMKDFPDLPKDIRELKKDFQKGTSKNYTSLESLLAKEGYVLRDQAAKKYALPSRPKTQRRKRPSKT